MTKFVQEGNCFRTHDDKALVTTDRLPVGTYTIGQDLNGWFIEQIEDFKLGKIYGEVDTKAERIVHTFNSREASTGVLLTGEKGCGKTMLAKLLSIELAKQDVPTIVINKPLCGESFNKLIQSIDQPAIIIFDEYEKVYEDKSDQNMLLTLLDGVYPTKKLFILTTNDRHGISYHMMNRPGRLFYCIEYKGLEEKFVLEYCEDKMNRKSDIPAMVRMSKLFEHFNFDMLKAVVEECNRYGETPNEAIKMMNIRVESWTRKFSVELTIDGKVAELQQGGDTAYIDPADDFYIQHVYKTTKLGNGEDHKHYTNCVFDADEHLIDIKEGVYTYEKVESGKLYRLTLGKAVQRQYSFHDMAMVA